MTPTIQQQIEANRKLLLALPEHLCFVRRWEPAILDYVVDVAWMATDHGVEIVEPWA